MPTKNAKGDARHQSRTCPSPQGPTSTLPINPRSEHRRAVKLHRARERHCNSRKLQNRTLSYKFSQTQKQPSSDARAIHLPASFQGCPCTFRCPDEKGIKQFVVHPC